MPPLKKNPTSPKAVLVKELPKEAQEQLKPLPGQEVPKPRPKLDERPPIDYKASLEERRTIALERIAESLNQLTQGDGKHSGLLKMLVELRTAILR